MQNKIDDFSNRDIKVGWNFLIDFNLGQGLRQQRVFFNIDTMLAGNSKNPLGHFPLALGANPGRPTRFIFQGNSGFWISSSHWIWSIIEPGSGAFTFGNPF